jgi:hypothetical protein
MLIELVVEPIGRSDNSCTDSVCTRAGNNVRQGWRCGKNQHFGGIVTADVKTVTGPEKTFQIIGNRGENMLVQVNWTNNGYNYVQDFMLDELIQSGRVARFLRSSGWVVVGVDPIRSGGSGRKYTGTDRRSSDQVTDKSSDLASEAH